MVVRLLPGVRSPVTCNVVVSFICRIKTIGVSYVTVKNLIKLVTRRIIHDYDFNEI